MSNLFKTSSRDTQKGSALFFAVLLGSIVLSLGLLISSVSFKEFQFSFFGKESQTALYAADTGLECAIYWDTYAYSPTSAFPDNSAALPAQTISCLGSGSFTPTVTSANASSATTEFYLKFSSNNNDPCVHVTVIKTLVGPNIRTTIESRGVDESDKGASDCHAASGQLRRVERAIRVRYGG